MAEDSGDSGIPGVPAGSPLGRILSLADDPTDYNIWVKIVGDILGILLIGLPLGDILDATINELIKEFEGLPENVQTARTGQRLAHSHVKVVATLGTWIVQQAAHDTILSDVGDLRFTFVPTISWVKAALKMNAQEAAALTNVIYSQHSIENFEKVWELRIHEQPTVPDFDTVKIWIGQHGDHRIVTSWIRWVKSVLDDRGKPPPPPPPPPPGPPPPHGPPQPPGPIPAVCNPQGDPTDDTGECLDTISRQVEWISEFIRYCCARQDGFDSQCCAQISLAIVAVSESITQLVSIWANNPNPPPPPTDLTPIVAAIGDLTGAVLSYAPLTATLDKCLCDGLASISKAIAEAKPVDIERIVNELKRANEMADVPKEIIEQMRAQGSLTADMAQLLGGSPWSHVISATIAEIGKLIGGVDGEVTQGLWLGLQKVIIPLAKVILGGLETFFAGWLEGFHLHAGQYLPAIEKAAVAGFDTLLQFAGTPAIAAIDFVREPLEAAGATRPGEHPDTIRRTLARAWIMGETAHALASFAGLLTYPTSRIFEGMAALVAHASGFDEILHRFHGPYYDAAIARPARFGANEHFRNDIPMLNIGANLYSRRIMPHSQLQDLFRFHGIATDYEHALTEGSYRPVSPRALATAFVDVPFPRDDIRELLRDNGLRDNAIEVLLDAMHARSISNLRNSYLSAVLTGAERGTLPRKEFEDAMQTLGFSDEAKQLCRLTVATKKLEQLDTLYRKSVSEAYRYGAISDADYVPHLEAIGIEHADAQAHYAIDSTVRHGKEALKVAASLAREETALKREAVKAALAQFSAGAIEEPQLVLELDSAGLSPAMTGFAAAIAEARRMGRETFVYGLLLPHAEAELLRVQVANVAQEVKRRDITPDIGLTRLAALNIPFRWRHEIIAKATPPEKPPPSTNGVSPA